MNEQATKQEKNHIFHVEDLSVLLEIVLDEASVLVRLHCSFIGGKCVVENFIFSIFLL
jgi:hypothetical protein